MCVCICTTDIYLGRQTGAFTGQDHIDGQQENEVPLTMHSTALLLLNHQTPNTQTPKHPNNTQTPNTKHQTPNY